MSKDNKMIKSLEVMTDEHDSLVLETYLDLAKNKILGIMYPYGYDEDTVVPTCYRSTWLEAAAYLINKRGAEGETRHNENGIDRTYDNGDLPRELRRRITPVATVV